MPATKSYENDVFLTKGTIGMKSISKLKTCTMAGCDHRMKILHFCLPGRRPRWTKVLPEGKDVFIDGFGVSRMRGKIRWEVARGPSEDAEKRRERFQIETGTRWENMGKPESWEGISAALSGAAAEVCGRGRLPGDLHCTSLRRDEILEKRAEVQAAYEKLTISRGTDSELQARAEHRNKKRQSQQLEREVRAELVQEICGEIEWARMNNDMGKFYSGIRQLGLRMKEDSKSDSSTIEPGKARQHFLDISGSENAAGLSSLGSVSSVPVDSQLDTEPSETEFDLALSVMKNSAGGADEVTIGMVKAAPSDVKRAIFMLLKKMWHTPEDTEWEPSTTRAVVIMLWKRKGSPEDLDMYRGICLLAIISRILARILGTRIALHLEATKQLQNFQWGFRAGRGCRDAILVLRIMCEMIADVDFAVEHNESIISRYTLAPAARSRLVELQSFLDEHRPFVYLADIKKAFPRTPRTLTWTGLAKRSVPPKLISVMKRLHEKTEYTVRLPVGDSETYFLKQGVREGCPSSPIVFVAHHDNGLQEIHEEIEGTFIESKSGLRCRGWTPVGDSVEYNLNCIGFADDHHDHWQSQGQTACY